MDAVVLVDSHDGRICDANPRAEELVGAPRDQIMDRPVSIFDGPGSTSFERLLRQTREQAGLALLEIPLTRRDGSTIYVDLTGSEVCYGDRNLVQFALRDVSDRRRLREALETTNLQLQEQRAELELVNERLKYASNMKSKFLASMSHEIRTPLNAIIGFAELLADESWGELNDQQRGFVTRIIDAGQHLLQLLNDVIDLSKVEAGTIVLEPGPVPINELVEQAAKVIKGTARSAGVSIVTVPDESRPVATADERRIKQVLFNLLSNAVRYSSEGSAVRVIVQSQDEWVTVSVVDQGVGIAEADQERVFEEFVSLGAPGQNPGGAGLGLPLSRNLVRMHGGELELDSKEGEGSTFRFRLPIARNPEGDGERPETPP